MYSSGSNQPIIVLKEGTERSKDKEAQFNNIAAAKAVADAVRSTLGPKGMDKMLVDSMGDVIVTNDGVTILKEVDVQHPAAKMVVEVAKTQDTECGDGTTSAVVLAGELLKLSEDLIDSNIHATVITSGYRMAADKAVEVIKSMAVDATDDKMLKKVAMTALVGKSVGGEQSHLADVIVKAVRAIESDDGKVNTDHIRVEKKVGGVIRDTYLVEGVVVDKQRVHSRMPKSVSNAKIALISVPFENKKTEMDAEISITDPMAMQSFLNQEESYLKSLVDKVVSTGANVVFCQKGVDDLVQHYFAKSGVFVCRRLKQSDMEDLARATGGRIIGNILEMQATDLGSAALVEEKLVGTESMTFVTGCKEPKALTIIIRGGTEHVIDEVDRALEDGIRVVGVAIEDKRVVAGAGAVEIEVGLRLADYASTVGGREQLAINAFAKAMEIIPWSLAENAGIDSIDAIIKLKNAHEKKKDGKNYGLDLDTGEAVDMLKADVVEPIRVKIQAIDSAAEVANMILRIDDVIASRRAPPMNPMGDPSLGGPGMGGIGGMM
ncbi:MAG: thermosome subunit alpha [Candidatus Methanomethylophilaceae archaeon]|nr:thermosome subunit alpha [Candidatus Methanomethylophilaceae archaeon]MDD2778694.1 thermosome subunit alpha [Candidatus Methanomethylophilaceae archaeon]MDD4119849.1 thermosome subunit alpha [Candidatus Methanomethylophilaceae archaeon]MDD4453874.1 thermosome subunit alpha [Candidatus Methanomethylophilaceae archaeon]MDI9378460.1 thermosome subunit alpha [Candidatus Thermoplasmatota archaeon]